jgi:lipopolysaccharide biosynthesis glycosyltransferase
MTNSNEKAQNIVIRHFNTDAKPWNAFRYGSKVIEHLEEFWFFASLTPFYADLQQQKKNIVTDTEFLKALRKNVMGVNG